MNNCKPRVLILLASYNGAPYIRAQLNSILNQRGCEVTIYVRDDGSSDGTQAILDAYSQTNVRVRIVRSGRLGRALGAGQNFLELFRAVQFSEADLVMLSDQDDIWHPAKAINAIRGLRSSGAAGYSSSVDAVWLSGERVRLNKAFELRRYDYLYESPGPGCTFALLPKVALLVQDFVISHRHVSSQIQCHDWFVYALVRHAGFDWVIDPESTIDYRQHRQNVAGANVGVGNLFKRLRAMCGGWYAQEVFLIRQALRLVDESSVPSKGRLLLNFLECRRRPHHALVILVFNLLFLRTQS